MVDIGLSLESLEEDVELVGDARVGALALGGQRERAPVLRQAQRPQQVRRILRQEAAARIQLQVQSEASEHPPTCG